MLAVVFSVVTHRRRKGKSEEGKGKEEEIKENRKDSPSSEDVRSGSLPT